MNVVGFSTIAAVIPDVNGVHVVVAFLHGVARFTIFASNPAFAAVLTLLAVQLLLSFLLLPVFLFKAVSQPTNR